jgi:hypothetical protein
MQQRILTGYQEQILKIGVRTAKPEQIRIIVSDAAQKNTVFTNRYNVVNGDKFFYIRMPMAPNVALVQVYNDANGPVANDNSFTMIGSDRKPGMGIEQMELEKKMDVVDMSNPDVRSFVDLGQRFSYNAGWLQTGLYKTGPVKISFLPALMDDKGKESATPARVGEESGIIEVSQKLCVPFTVPMRFAILCHEFAHFYLNHEKYSEIEADLQGLLIYLGLGYPHIEAHQAFLETFIGTPTELNKKRYDIIKRFIKDFENHKFLTY